MAKRSGSSALRYLLGGLLAFGAVNAFGGGYYGLSGAEGVPTDWLEGSSFSDYFIPSLFLFTVVGGSFLFAAIAVFSRFRIARASAFAAGAVVLAWIAVQLAIIGYVRDESPSSVPVGWVPASRSQRLLVLALARLLPPHAEGEARGR